MGEQRRQTAPGPRGRCGDCGQERGPGVVGPPLPGDSNEQRREQGAGDRKAEVGEFHDVECASAAEWPQQALEERQQSDCPSRAALDTRRASLEEGRPPSAPRCCPGWRAATAIRAELLGGVPALVVKGLSGSLPMAAATRSLADRAVGFLYMKNAGPQERSIKRLTASAFCATRRRPPGPIETFETDRNVNLRTQMPAWTSCLFLSVMELTVAGGRPALSAVLTASRDRSGASRALSLANQALVVRGTM